MLIYRVQNIHGNMRLDRYLRTIHKSFTQGYIEKGLRNGKIKLNGNKTKSSHRVVNNDEILIYGDKISQSPEKQQNFNPLAKGLAQKILNEYIILDSEYFFAINKPSGLPTQSGSKISVSIDCALQYLNATTGSEFKICHRIDRETTGILVIAKSRYAATILCDAFKQHQIRKKYIAVLCGKDLKKSGKIESYLVKKLDKVYETSAYDTDAKIAITYYNVLAVSDKLSIVEFTPLTGRTHQIRCHATYSLNAPILGDLKYGGHEADSMYLHAIEILIPHSLFGCEYLLYAECPEKYKKLS